jgi:uncharacterized protein (TIGR02996 family)
VSDREALLAAIRANPDDDTPRLMFADWLDEHEPDAKPRKGKGKAGSPAPSSWAALIRAECEFEQLRNDGAATAVFDHLDEEDPQTFDSVRWERALPEMQRRLELFRLIPALRRRSEKTRTAGHPSALPGAAWSDVTHRGFPYQVGVVDGDAWVERLPELMRFCPRVRIDLDSSDPLTRADELVAAGLARWCRCLGFQASAPHANVIAAMASSPDTAGVRALHCGWEPETALAQILTTVAESPHWSGLRELRVDSPFNVPADVPGRLFRAPHLRGLTHLRLSGIDRTAEVVAALEGLTELRSLSLTRSDLDDDDACRLAQMPGLSKLRLLHLQFDRITGRGATALLTSPHLKNLAVLDFEGNPVRGLDRAALANAPAGGLRLLNFQSGRLTGADLAAITSCPRVSELMFFAACFNPFRESAVARLVKGFGARAPAVLYLMGNNISTVGAQALASWPAATQIDMLHLSQNELSVPAARAIAGCPHLQQLNHLCAAVGHPKARSILQQTFGERADV